MRHGGWPSVERAHPTTIISGISVLTTLLAELKKRERERADSADSTLGVQLTQGPVRQTASSIQHAKAGAAAEEAEGGPLLLCGGDDVNLVQSATLSSCVVLCCGA